MRAYLMERIHDSSNNLSPINWSQKNDSNDTSDEGVYPSLSSESEGWETTSSKKSNKKISEPSNLSVRECQIKLDELYNDIKQRTSSDYIQKATVLLNNLKDAYEKNMGTPLRNMRKEKALFARDENDYYDLHGFSRGAAYYFLRKTINNSSFKENSIKIIPGKGLHSRNMGNEQPLMLVIQEVCNDCKFEYTADEHNEGSGVLKRRTNSEHSNTSKNQMRLTKSTSFSSSTNSTPKHSNCSTPLKNKSIGRNASDTDSSFETTDSDSFSEFNVKNHIYSEQKEASSAQCSEEIKPQQNDLSSIEKDDSILKHRQPSSIEAQTVKPKECTYPMQTPYQQPMQAPYQQPMQAPYPPHMYAPYPPHMYAPYPPHMQAPYPPQMHAPYPPQMHASYLHSMQYGQPTVCMPPFIMHYTLTIPHQYSSRNLPPPSFQHQEFNQYSQEANQKPLHNLPSSAPDVSFKKLSQSTTPFFNNHIKRVNNNHTDDPNNNPSTPNIP